MITKAPFPCLWFDSQAEEAAVFYTSVFEKSRILEISRFSGEGKEIHGKDEGSVMTVTFELNGQLFTALNGGPVFSFNEAVSFQVFCDSQEEIDFYWEKLSEGGRESQCGWLSDRYGLSWQIVPSVLPELLKDPERSRRVSSVLYGMKKLVISSLVEA